MEYNQLV